MALRIRTPTALTEAMRRDGETIDRATVGRIEDGTAGDSTYDRVEAWLAKRERLLGKPVAEVASRPAEVDPSSQDLEVMEFEVEGPTTKWRVHAKATKGNADEAVAAIAKLLAMLPEPPGDAEE